MDPQKPTTLAEAFAWSRQQHTATRQAPKPMSAPTSIMAPADHPTAEQARRKRWEIVNRMPYPDETPTQ
ncbi:MAG: hypothetical protein J2P37_36330 [Ktedonobacteraceae bacterium]|nr:hypothetical protein [Ktedonobacteraceae bacterium]MBO0794479.1 hypothetical protein [Ktedonobacteraceae bacterium]